MATHQRPGTSTEGVSPKSTLPPMPADSDLASDRAAAALVKRILVAHQPSTAGHSIELPSDPAVVDASLPPLTSSNEIDLQLYALIAILVKDCIYSWYSKFTTDHVFIDDVVEIIAHITRALEERLRNVNLERVVLDELPALVKAHIHAFRDSQRMASAHNAAPNRRTAYSMLRAHPALLPVPDSNIPFTLEEQQQNDRRYRHLLSGGMLALLLPTDDLRNPCLRSLLSELLGDMILGGVVSNKLCDGLFLYEMFSRVAEGSIRYQKPWAHAESSKDKITSGDRLARFGLLSGSSSSQKNNYSLDVSNIGWAAVHFCVLAINALRLLVELLVSVSQSPSRVNKYESTSSNVNAGQDDEGTYVGDHSSSAIPPGEPGVSAIIAYRVWPTLACIVDLQARMPWLAGITALSQHLLLFSHGKLGSSDSLLDRILAHHLLAPTFPLSRHVPAVLRSLRITLFPNNSLAPSATPSSKPPVDLSIAKSQARRAAAFALLNALPPKLAKVYFSPAVQGTPGMTADEKRRQEIEQMVQAIEVDILAPFGDDEYLTRHLMYALLDRVVVEVFPELDVKGVDEILREKEVDLGTVP